MGRFVGLPAAWAEIGYGEELINSVADVRSPEYPPDPERFVIVFWFSGFLFFISGIMDN